MFSKFYELAHDTSLFFTYATVVLTALGSIFVYLFKLYKKTKIIYLALTPNGGSSLSDVINQIRTHQRIGEMRLQVVWENMAQGYYECNAEGECTFANKKLCNLFGLSLNDMLGSGWSRALVSQEERNRVLSEWENALRHQIPYDTTYQIRNQRSGEVAKYRTQAWACKDKEGNNLWMFGTLSEAEE